MRVLCVCIIDLADPGPASALASIPLPLVGGFAFRSLLVVVVVLLLLLLVFFADGLVQNCMFNACTRCLKEGHLAEACPEEEVMELDPKPCCSLCGKGGHSIDVSHVGERGSSGLEWCQYAGLGVEGYGAFCSCGSRTSSPRAVLNCSVEDLFTENRSDSQRSFGTMVINHGIPI